MVFVVAVVLGVGVDVLVLVFVGGFALVVWVGLGAVLGSLVS